MTTLTIEEILKKTSDLPSMPAAALAVMREVDSSTSSAHSISAHLMHDQALTMRVLRLANSAFYGLSRQVMSAQEAVVVLGTRTIRHLCLVASTYPWLSRPLAGYELGPEQLFNHSLAVAVGSQLIAEQTGRVQRDDAFTAGLLHNIGKVAMSVWLENKIQAMQLLAERDGLSFDEVERKVFGFDHAEIGAALSDNWNLPKSLIQAIRYHHAPEKCETTAPMVDAVHIADFMAMSLGYGIGGDGLQYDFNEEALRRLGLSVDTLEEFAGRVIELYDQHQTMFASEAKAA